MPRFKRCDTSMKLLPVNFAAQILPGSFEHALCHLVDTELDLSALVARFRNDAGGAPAYPPGVLLKIVLLAYSRGLTSSRSMARACRENVLFMAVSSDLAPHFTTLADFVSSLGDEIVPLFGEVLLVCDRLGLIGRQMFAIDGVKLPSNASKTRSGTRAELQARAAKMQAQAQKMIARHQAQDASKDGAGVYGNEGADDGEAAAQRLREQRCLARITQEVRQTRAWLAAHPDDRKGSRDGVVMSNLTDNESAKMATSKGVIQGYTGVVAVDDKHQIVMAAQAHGSGSEQALLLPMLTALEPLCTPHTVLTTDAGYHSVANVTALEARGRPAFICDNQYRQRDPRYADQVKHRAKKDPLHDKSGKTVSTQQPCYKPADFQLAADDSHCVCPAGKRLYRDGGNCTINGYKVIRFRSNASDCGPCAQRQRCLQKPAVSQTRQVAFFQGKRDQSDSAADRMKARIDSEEGRAMIAARFATVEPVFGNLRHNKRLHRFTLRGQKKVDRQWKLMCMMHNIEKLAHHGYGW